MSLGFHLHFLLPGDTDTDKALDFLLLEGFKGGRDYAPNVAVVITDGRSNNKTKTKLAAEAVKKAGTTVFAIGINFRFSLNYIEQIS